MNAVRPYAEGAVICSVYLILLFLFFYTPLGLVVFFVLGVPHFIYASRHGWRLGALMLAAGVLLSMLLTGWPGALYTVYYGLTGMLMGALHQRGKNTPLVLFTGFLAGILLFVLFLVGMTLVLHINIAEQIKSLADSYMEMSRSMLQGLGLEGSIQQEMIAQMFRQLVDLLPLMLVMQATLTSFVTYKFSNPILKRLGMPVMALPPYRDWKLPREMIYYYLAVLVFSLFVQRDQGALYIIVLNLRQLMDFIFVIQGGSFIFHIAHVKQWNRSAAVFLLIIGFLLSPVLGLLGLFDTAFQLKARMSR